MHGLHIIGLAVARLWPIGLSPGAPGTVASFCAAAAAPWLFLPLPIVWRVVTLAALFILGGWSATLAEHVLSEKDPPSVVIDELVGQWIVLLPLFLPILKKNGPAAEPASSSMFLIWLLIGFGLFRLFDIWKPWLVRSSENWLPGGWGVMIDDVVAGVFGLIVMSILLKLWTLV